MRTTSLLAYDVEHPLLFTSGTFLLLFIGFLLGDAALTLAAGAARPQARASRWSRLGYLYLFSLFFYYKTSGWFVCLLLATTTLDYWLARAIAAGTSATRRRCYLVVSLTCSLAPLAYLKYANFLVGNLYALFESPFHGFEVVLPVGISFYTFQSVSYVVDVYRGRLEPAHSLLGYALYLSFFPQIVAGPIVRADVLLPQLEAAPNPDFDDVREGLFRILVGVLKKGALADYLVGYCDSVFVDYRALTGTEVWLGFYAYALLIYFDFSGYSDLAIGLARVLGYRLPENFSTPYRACSISEFWRRWHISLSEWLRDYLYVPLGGNRRGSSRRDLNLLITMLLGGLWHGAAWQFLVWGLWHGTGLVVQKRLSVFTRKWRFASSGRPSLGYQLAGWLVTLHFVIFGWTLFRAPSLTQWLGVWSRAGEASLAELPVVLSARAGVVGANLLGFVFALLPSDVGLRVARGFRAAPIWVRGAVLVLAVQVLIEVRQVDVAPFIYFRF